MTSHKQAWTKGPESIRWNGRTSDLPAHERYCTCCGRELSAAHRMLEHDQRTGGYHDFQDVPEFHSQGWFPFGLTCAANAVKHETELRAALTKAEGGKDV